MSWRGRCSARDEKHLLSPPSPQAHTANPLYLAPSALGDFTLSEPSSSGGGVKEIRISRLSDPTANKLRFGISHYAEPVVYSAHGWMDKNRAFLQV